MKIDPELKQDLKNYLQQRLREEAKGKVTILAPYKLSNEEIDTLKKKIDILQDADITTEKDESMLAGIIIRYGSRMIDLSLKTELQKLEKTLYETA